MATVVSSLAVNIWSLSGEKQQSKMGLLCILVREVRAVGSWIKSKCSSAIIVNNIGSGL